ncbi:MAG: hypothetical protein Q8O33_16665 [Pseudomonadota bacterium]|nr:hypothetical protein [Pseudomonadota bacterium]
MKRHSHSQVFSGFLLIFLTLLSFAAGAARLEMDRNELVIGELTTVHLKGAPFIALVDWKVSEELAIVDSDSNHVQVRGIRAGSGTVTCNMNLSVHSVNITVRAAAPVQTTLPTPLPQAPPPAYTAPAYTAPAPAPVHTAPSHPAPVPAAADAGSSLAGTWQLNANGYTGKLELSSNQDMLNGRVWFDAHATWETLKELYFDDAIGELSFTRPGANQSYRGRLRGNTLEGRFTQWSGGGYSANAPTYAWTATLPGAAVKPAATPYAYPASAGESSSLRLARDRYAPGEAIVVDFTASGSYADNAWVGIIPSHIPHGSEAENDRHDLTYQYLRKRTSGSLTFTAPMAPGNYDLRLHDTDNNGREVASVSFQVRAVASPDIGQGQAAPTPAAPQGGSDDSLKDVMNQLKGVFGR